MTLGIDALHCPNCGAPADPDAGRCAYCRARLAAVACPSCFAAMFEGAAFCPRCGAARARGTAAPSDERCPGCRADMAAVSVGAVPMLECPACDGVWLDAAAFERICTDGEARAAVIHRPGGTGPATTEQRFRYRPCLRCGRMMNRVNFARLSGTIVDVCRGHGTFLDRGELHAVASFIHDGGLDRMRERELSDIQEAHRRQAAENAKASRSQEAGSSVWDAASLAEIVKAMRGW